MAAVLGGGPLEAVPELGCLTSKRLWKVPDSQKEGEKYCSGNRIKAWQSSEDKHCAHKDGQLLSFWEERMHQAPTPTIFAR